MASFVLIPGAGGAAWYWHRVVPLLEEAGHEAIPVDLPGNDDRAGIERYADLVVRAIGARTDVVLVAQSMGAFTAAMVAARIPVRSLVLVNAMIPRPNEKADEWWNSTHWEASRASAAEIGGYSKDFDIETYFFHDVPKETMEEGAQHERPETKAAFIERCRFDRWPDVPIHVVIGEDDRFFPPTFQVRVVRERLRRANLTVDHVRGGHLVALSNPEGLVARLLTYS
jgi:pimeloyl-ACP methyl ester carboxylesterase